MSKVKHVLWITALVLALAAPTSGAEETSAGPGWFEQLIAQIVAAVIGPAEPPPASLLVTPPPGQEPELGEHAPVNG